MLYKVTEVQTIYVDYHVHASNEEEAEENYAFEGVKVATDIIESSVYDVEEVVT